MNLQQILDQCLAATEVDSEGDPTYRIHYKEAERLIKLAFKVGEISGMTHAINKIDEVIK